MAKMQYQGTGRRKSSVARVRLIPGTGKITVNKKDLEDYFGMEIVKREVKRPFEIAGCEGKFDVIATVHGGGFTGQDKITHMRLLKYCYANYRTASLNTIQMSTIYQFEPLALNIFIINIPIPAMGQHGQNHPLRLHLTDTSTSTKSIYQTIQPTIQPLAQNRNKSGAY